MTNPRFGRVAAAGLLSLALALPAGEALAGKKTRNTLLGAGIGAAAGGLIGGSTESAVVGGVAGGVIGNVTTKKKKRYARSCVYYRDGRRHNRC